MADQSFYSNQNGPDKTGLNNNMVLINKNENSDIHAIAFVYDLDAETFGNKHDKASKILSLISKDDKMELQCNETLIFHVVQEELNSIIIFNKYDSTVYVVSKQIYSYNFNIFDLVATLFDTAIFKVNWIWVNNNSKRYLLNICLFFVKNRTYLKKKWDVPTKAKYMAFTSLKPLQMKKLVNHRITYDEEIMFEDDVLEDEILKYIGETDEVCVFKSLI